MTIYKKSDGYEPEDLLHSLIGHYGAAKVLLNESPEAFDSGGYILHLSVELMLKSCLLHINDEFNGTHSLQHLRQDLVASGIPFPLTKQDN
ncbi:MAG: hypothetical protein OEY29_11010 [Gammaproteobacteria bacterium]|nr:hypothetical protein [Gammaproteobacteria bacterium]